MSSNYHSQIPNSKILWYEMLQYFRYRTEMYHTIILPLIYYGDDDRLMVQGCIIPPLIYYGDDDLPMVQRCIIPPLIYYGDDDLSLQLLSRSHVIGRLLPVFNGLIFYKDI